MLSIEKKVQPFNIGVDHCAGNAVFPQGPRQAGNPRRRFTGFGNGGMDQ
jgi:hypothetical protein